MDRVKTITQKVVVSATPDEVYDAWVQAKKHAAFTESPATGAARVGGKFTAWDGYIIGVHRELVPGRKIVQDWWTTEWPDGAPPSRLELTFKAVKGGTEVQMVHSNVPAEQADGYRQGWVDFYWTPLKAYFSKTNTR
jgi:activator of HSP90 ATPase